MFAILLEQSSLHLGGRSIIDIARRSKEGLENVHDRFTVGTALGSYVPYL